MVYVIIFLVLTITAALSLAAVLVLSVCRAFAAVRRKTNPRQLTRLKRAAVFFVVVLLLNLGLVGVSQFTAKTPQIFDEDGNTPPNAIAELTAVELNGSKQQWISLRGWDKDNPVILFLAGGPGGTQMGAVRRQLAELEKHFVVVNWDQPGSGKSYYAGKCKDITADTYIEDGRALTEYLKERFNEEKIYLIGESWGSALGIFLAAKYPQDYHAFIGTGQMVDFLETERIDYAKAMELAGQRGDWGIVKRLKKNGEPPYYGKDVTWKSAVYLNYLNAYMAGIPGVKNPGYNTLQDIASPEYGLLDKINFLRGIINTFNEVYPKLYDIDLRKDYTKIDVPVYFFLGRHDYNAPTALTEEYERTLEAPKKGIVWFEHSAHSPWINEPEKFTEEVIKCFSED